MRDRIAKWWSGISPGQGIALAGMFVAVGYVAVRMPAEFWEGLSQKDPATLGAGVGGFLVALWGVFQAPKLPPAGEP